MKSPEKELAKQVKKLKKKGWDSKRIEAYKLGWRKLDK